MAAVNNSDQSMTPMVSVAMIAFNKEREIADAIRGVVGQRAGFPIELVIVDDASTDSTHDVALAWQKRYPEMIRVVRNPSNKGLQANYIEAFRHCRGRYLAICDADDYWICRTKLARQVAYMEAHQECALTFHRVVNYYESTGEMSLSNGGMRSDCDAAALSRSNFITNLSVVYRRELVDLSALPDWILDDRSPDYAMHMFYAAQGSIHYFSRPMGLYRIGPKGAWSQTEAYRRLEMSLIVREHLIGHFASRTDLTAGLREAASSILLGMIEAAAGDPARCADARLRLKRIGVIATDQAIDEALAARRGGRRPVMARMLSKARAIASRLLPVPRPPRV